MRGLKGSVKMNDKKIKFNGMDLFIILMVVIIAAAGVYILFGRNGSAVSSSQNVTVETVIELTAMTEDFTELIKEGDVVLVGEKEKMRTNVKKIEIEPAKTTGYDILNGKVLRSVLPDEYDVKITLVGEGAETDSTVEMNGAAIRVGQKEALTSKNWAGYGYVIGLDVVY